MQRNVQRIIIFANGELPDTNRAHSLIQYGDYIICADGGTRHALTLNITPDLIVGDMDSAAREELHKFQNDNVPMDLYPRDKNETDLELAINRAIQHEPRQIIIIAALGGRLDQTLGNIALLSDARLAHFDIRLDDGVEEVFLCRDQVEVHGGRGDIVSLIPWQGPALNVRTEGLQWPLNDETLHSERTRGISNEMLGDTASISIGSGLLLIVHRRLQ